MQCLDATTGMATLLQCNDATTSEINGSGGLPLETLSCNRQRQPINEQSGSSSNFLPAEVHDFLVGQGVLFHRLAG